MKTLLTCVLALALGSTAFAQTNCDPAIHDEIKTSVRTPTECERQLDLKIREAIAAAFASVKEIPNWMVESETAATEIGYIAPETAKTFYTYHLTDLGSYELKLVKDPTSELSALQARLNNPTQKDVEAFKEATAKLMAATNIAIVVEVNTQLDASVFKGGHKMLQVPGVTYAWQGAYVQSLGGGDTGSDATLLYLGKTAAPTFEKLSDGSEAVPGHPTFPNDAPLLSVQNIFVRIDANAELAQEVMKRIDFAKLNSLIR